jgi:iron(III) transport system substrate-binding protein
MTVRSRRTLRAVAAVVAVFLAVVACGASPTDTPGAGPAAGGGGEALADVYAAVDGLTGQERFDTLLELAEAEGGEVSFYHASDMKPLVDGFHEKTGLRVLDFKATSERVSERLVQEQTVGKPGSDLFLVGVQDTVGLRDGGVIDELRSPVLDTVEPMAKADGLVSPLVILLMPTYNTDTVRPDQLPTSWEEFFTDFSARKAIEVTDWQWYQTLVTKYFMAQKGMTEEQAKKLVTDGLTGAFTVDGHTLQGTLLASGQYDYAPTMYSQYAVSHAKAGAPVSYEGLAADMPPIATGPMPLGITKGARHPATALLFLEYMMSAEGQNIIADMNYVPTASTYVGETLLDEFPQTIFMEDVSNPLPAGEKEKWIAEFDVLYRSIGGTELKG